MLTDQEIAREIAEPAAVDAAAEQLLDLVLARGAVDNVTIVIVAVEPVA
jgi:serine/threonine protein phosphatase PrpC